ncbi:MAG: hypothetical protein VX065_06180 [Pseudomonadota bacterium]|nr:hypothetical protein [Pseudomonadota bacterium]
MLDPKTMVFVWRDAGTYSATHALNKRSTSVFQAMGEFIQSEPLESFATVMLVLVSALTNDMEMLSIVQRLGWI